MVHGPGQNSYLHLRRDFSGRTCRLTVKAMGQLDSYVFLTVMFCMPTVRGSTDALPSEILGTSVNERQKAQYFLALHTSLREWLYGIMCACMTDSDYTLQ